MKSVNRLIFIMTPTAVAIFLYWIGGGNFVRDEDLAFSAGFGLTVSFLLFVMIRLSDAKKKNDGGYQPKNKSPGDE